MDHYLNSGSDYFWLKNEKVKSGLEIYFEILRPPSELLLPSAKKPAQNSILASIFEDFRIKNSRPLFTTIIFEPKKGVSRLKILVYVLILAVLGGVEYFQHTHSMFFIK